MLQAGSVTIGNTPTLIFAASVETQLQIVKTGGQTVKLGPVSVTFQNGFTLTRSSVSNDTPLILTLHPGTAVYGICDRNQTATVDYITTNSGVQ